MAENTTIRPATAAQRQVAQLQELTSRRENLGLRLARTQAMAETAQRNLDEARAEARERVGTDDVPTLRQQYQTALQENEHRLRTFEDALSTTETALVDVERSVGISSDSAARA